MPTERGVVKTLHPTRRFGFIERPLPPGQAKLQDVFFLFGAYPQGQAPTIGDELEFEPVLEVGKKGPKATNITIVAKVLPGTPASPPAVTAAAASQSAGNNRPAVPTTVPAPEPLDVIVEFLYDPKQIVSTQEEFSLSVIVMVTQPISSAIVRGATVDLLCDGHQVNFPAACPQTNHKGETQFRIVYARTYDADTGVAGTPLSITQVSLAAVVTKGGRRTTVTELVPRSKEWKAQEVPAPPAPPPPPLQPDPEPDRLEVDIAAYPNADGLFLTSVTTFAGDRKVKGKATINSSDVLTALAADGTTSAGTGAMVCFQTEGDGTGVLFLGFASPVQALVTLKLSNGKGKPQQRLLRKP